MMKTKYENYRDYHCLSQKGKTVFDFIKRNYNKEESSLKITSESREFKYKDYEIICFDDYIGVFFGKKQIEIIYSEPDIEIIYKFMYNLYYNKEINKDIVEAATKKHLFNQMEKI